MLGQNGYGDTASPCQGHQSLQGAKSHPYSHRAALLPATLNVLHLFPLFPPVCRLRNLPTCSFATCFRGVREGVRFIRGFVSSGAFGDALGQSPRHPCLPNPRLLPSASGTCTARGRQPLGDREPGCSCTQRSPPPPCRRRI